jgi:hypothetical protein
MENPTGLYKTRRTNVIALLLVSIAVFAMPSFAFADAAVNFTYPSGIDKDDVIVYSGFPNSNLIVNNIGNMIPLTAEPDGSYVIDAGGAYTYLVSKDGYYRIAKVFNISSGDVIDGNTVSREIETGPVGGDGFEPSNPNLPNAPDNYLDILDWRDHVIGVYPDEVLAHFTTDGLRGYKEFTTPAFAKRSEMALHQFTNQDQMMEFIEGVVDGSDYAHLYILGKTANYDYDVPIVIITKSDIPESATFLDAARIIRENGKLNVWHQAQIHPNEPAAGECGLAMLQEMTGAYGEDLLDKINFISVPRLNPDGSYLFTRQTYGGFDMNRDHMRLQAIELDYSHGAYTAIMPEVVMDSHEFTYWTATRSPNNVTSRTGYMANADDVQSTPASSLNNSREVNEFAMNVVSSRLHDSLAGLGLRNNHYQQGNPGYTVVNPIGRAYFGLFNSVSILIETRGIGAGRTNFPRRVFAATSAVKSITETSALYAPRIKSMVAQARQEIIDKGRVYGEPEDVLALYQSAEGGISSDYKCQTVRFNIDGTLREVLAARPISMPDTILHSRTRPTAYIIPKDAGPGLINLDLALYITKAQGAEVYEIAPGSSVSVEQYYNKGDWETYSSSEYGSVNVIITPSADLRPEREVTFERGAYVIPMDQVAGNVMGMLWEPDVRDSYQYNGSLAQSKIVSHDTGTDNYAYYRFTKNNPRDLLLQDLTEPPYAGGYSFDPDGSGVTVEESEEAFSLLISSAELRDGESVRLWFLWSENGADRVTYADVTVAAQPDGTFKTTAVPFGNIDGSGTAIDFDTTYTIEYQSLRGGSGAAGYAAPGFKFGSEPAPVVSGGSGGGCAAGFGAFALLFSAGAIAVMRGKK